MDSKDKEKLYSYTVKCIKVDIFHEILIRPFSIFVSEISFIIPFFFAPRRFVQIIKLLVPIENVSYPSLL